MPNLSFVDAGISYDDTIDVFHIDVRAYCEFYKLKTNRANRRRQWRLLTKALSRVFPDATFTRVRKS